MPRFVFSTADTTFAAGQDLRSLLGGKGAGLVDMHRLGLPVPPAFVISTEAFHSWLALRDLGFLKDELDRHIGVLEAQLERTLGGADRPLIVSVRSGAPVSMPGMMDTILNLGLNRKTVKGLAREWTPEAADQAYARLRHSYEAIVGAKLPEDPRAQLLGAIAAVFASWDSERARTYRARGGISHKLGTAATVQAMVFGTAPGFSGTGVMFTRHPSTGAAEVMGDWLADAQGEDVVAGTHQTEPLEALAQASPVLWQELVDIAARLELHQRDMCDIEFTIESGKLWVLQYRRGKRSPQSAVRIAVEMAQDARFAISPREAVERVLPDDLAALLAERRADTGSAPVATGLGASPGVASGKACFSVDSALDKADAGEPVILVRPETSPDDIPGMDVAEGILTSTGGLVSHAAIVAREWRKPAVVGTSALVFDGDVVTVGGEVIREGDEITIDGATGHVYLGSVAGASAEADSHVCRLIEWAREIAGTEGEDPVETLRMAHARIAAEKGEHA
ncbi:pyruvate, phosphate dikinase [Novosphingobium sp. PASSN1]|uniref:pyruvate, phosphate dikinase n=1 Tax=Novosphingobium sp. PASSN1 TaxID=2015561 RepID=UPI000BC8A39F|nr:pyruvate, phosphate dikinase [Novosphingobium sp. PASSN1]OYU34739.1 MAG: pyruvate, phosphate dikinase [Novosphingobium sp. PASSN1]